MGLFFLCAWGTLIAPSLEAWPSSAQWVPIYRSGVPVTDPNGDTNGSRNVVSDAANPAAYVYNDGTYLYFRMRLDSDPSGTGGQGLLQAFGWGVVIDTNRNAGDYEFMIMLDGIDKNENIALRQNTAQGTLGDPSDVPELPLSSVPLMGEYQISAANTSFNGSLDYFLDWRFSYASFKSLTGLTDSSPIRLFEGSSPSAGNLRENGGDLLGGSTLYDGFSDFLTPKGRPASDGVVRFVSDLAGTADVTNANPDDPIFIQVSDSDRNLDAVWAETVTITLTSSLGDTETVTLTETGVNTGIFSSSILSVSWGAATPGDGKIRADQGTLATATFIDLVTVTGTTNVPRTDSLTFGTAGPPLLSLTKITSTAAAIPGTEIIYTLVFKNTGTGSAKELTINDQVPAFTTYIPGTLRLGGPASTYDNASPKTDATDADEGQIASDVILFRLPTLAPGGEGKAYFKVLLN